MARDRRRYFIVKDAATASWKVTSRSGEGSIPLDNLCGYAGRRPDVDGDPVPCRGGRWSPRHWNEVWFTYSVTIAAEWAAYWNATWASTDHRWAGTQPWHVIVRTREVYYIIRDSRISHTWHVVEGHPRDALLAADGIVNTSRIAMNIARGSGPDVVACDLAARFHTREEAQAWIREHEAQQNDLSQEEVDRLRRLMEMDAQRQDNAGGFGRRRAIEAIRRAEQANRGVQPPPTRSTAPPPPSQQVEIEVAEAERLALRLLLGPNEPNVSTSSDDKPDDAEDRPQRRIRLDD